MNEFQKLRYLLADSRAPRFQCVYAVSQKNESFFCDTLYFESVLIGHDMFYEMHVELTQLYEYFKCMYTEKLVN